MNNILEETRFIINKYNIRANKSLGQNFLVNENVVSSIVECSNITKEDLVIEIGPGLGTLTKELLEKAGKVVCIELDTKMLKILNDRFVLYKNLEILNEDVLKVDLHTLIKEQKEKIINHFKDFKVINYDIVNSFIDYIEIGEKDRKTKTQDIIIRWNF